MIFCTTDFTLPYLNFAAEYYLATRKHFDEDVFMLWRNEPSVIIGRYQNAYEEVNLEYIKEKDIHLARRMSGGGTVYHDLGCWEFTFITEKADENIEFERFMNPIAEALRKLGLDVRITGRNDIMLYPDGGERGYKISGNTQYKKGNVTVHHGTLLFDTDIEEMVKSTTPAEYKITSKAIKSVRERVTNIRKWLSNDMTGEEFARRIGTYMTDSEYILNEEDLAAIHELKDFFESRKWIYGETPAFDIKKTVSFEGGTLEFGFTVKKGIIVSAGLSGDFFSSDDPDLDAALSGVEFSPEEVSSALKRNCSGIFKFDIDETVRNIFS